MFSEYSFLIDFFLLYGLLQLIKLVYVNNKLFNNQLNTYYVHGLVFQRFWFCN